MAKMLVRVRNDFSLRAIPMSIDVTEEGETVRLLYAYLKPGEYKDVMMELGQEFVFSYGIHRMPLRVTNDFKAIILKSLIPLVKVEVVNGIRA